MGQATVFTPEGELPALLPGALSPIAQFTVASPHMLRALGATLLAGRDFSETRLVGKDGALVTYGDGLDGIAVLEHKPGPQSEKQGQGGAGGPLGRTELPTVSIDGTSAQELSTPLGTVIRFERDGVSYTVIGSVDKATAEAAARAL